MKYILLLLLLASFGCKKKTCQTCTEVVFYSNGTTTLQRDTLYKDMELCGEDLQTAKDKNGKPISPGHMASVFCK